MIHLFYLRADTDNKYLKTEITHLARKKVKWEVYQILRPFASKYI